MMAGTPFYLAPEVLKGVKNAKSDIWSIGVLTYAMLSGHLPFVSDADETVFHKAIKGEYNFDLPVWDKISGDAKDLIKKMVCVDLNKRLNATQCLTHDWFHKVEEDFSDFDDNTSFAENLKLIRSKTAMQNAAYKFVKKALETNDIEKLHQEFAKAANGEEEVNILDFKRIIADFSPEMSSDQLDELVHDILKTQSLTGKINYVKLLIELDNITEYNQDTKIWLTFNKYADDDTGFIKFKHLLTALKGCNIHTTDQKIKDICLVLHIPIDEDIDFDQFKNIVIHKNKKSNTQ